MTDAQVEKLGRSLAKRVKFWATHPKLAKLGVSHWDIQVTISEAPGGRRDSKAAMHSSPYYDTARMDFNLLWIEEEKPTPRDLDETVVHELLHAVTRDLTDAQTLPGCYVPPGVEELWEDRVDHDLEGVIDRVARTIVACIRD